MNEVSRHPEERRVLELLSDLIGVAGIGVETIEQRLGWQQGRLSDLLESRHGIAVQDLLEVLPLLDLKPEDFFARLYGFRQKEPSVEKAAGARLDRRFEESRRVVEEALARRALWKRERESG